MKATRKILIFVLIILHISAQALPRFRHIDPYRVQLTVWNQTDQSVLLVCTPTKGVTMDQTQYKIAVNESPAILLTANHYGKLVQCKMEGTPATFDYSMITPEKENVVIGTVPQGQANFYYEAYYTGSLIYR